MLFWDSSVSWGWESRNCLFDAFCSRGKLQWIGCKTSDTGLLPWALHADGVRRDLLIRAEGNACPLPPATKLLHTRLVPEACRGGWPCPGAAPPAPQPGGLPPPGCNGARTPLHHPPHVPRDPGHRSAEHRHGNAAWLWPSFAPQPATGSQGKACFPWVTQVTTGK